MIRRCKKATEIGRFSSGINGGEGVESPFEDNDTLNFYGCSDIF